MRMYTAQTHVFYRLIENLNGQSRFYTKRRLSWSGYDQDFLNLKKIIRFIFLAISRQ